MKEITDFFEKTRKIRTIFFNTTPLFPVIGLVQFASLSTLCKYIYFWKNPL